MVKIKIMDIQTENTEYVNDEVIKLLNENKGCVSDKPCTNNCNIQCKIFPIGSVVYYVEKLSLASKTPYYVNWGVVKEHYPGQVTLQLYEPRDLRTIEGVPIKEFHTPTKWRKLPKDWSYDSKLFTIDTPNVKTPCCNNHEEILKMIQDGVLVEVIENDHAEFRAEISKTNGWRIIRTYNYDSVWQSSLPKNRITMYVTDLYSTHDKAQAAINDIYAEWKRQSELSDYEWSVEQIDKVLNKWSSLYHIDDETKRRYRDWILQLDKVENVEIRTFNGEVEWKYWKNIRWKTIQLPIF